MSSTILDKFDREDGPIGESYLIPCGTVSISDETVIPVGLSGASPETYVSAAGKVQVLYVSSSPDSPDNVVRLVWSCDLFPPTGQPALDVDSDPAVTALARMSKDPLLVDLGEEEDPYCYDQGYGCRVTCPRDGSAPILKLIKFAPILRAPSLRRPSSLEPDGARVLASITLQATDLNLDPAWSGTGDMPFRGYLQEMRLRIRRGESEVVLEAFLNDRHMNMPILTFTDKRDPLWSVIGRPGFDFLNAIDDLQPVGASPYALTGTPLMRVSLFETQTLKDFQKPVSVSPDNFYTYDEVVRRVITIVEKDGDPKFTSTAGKTKSAVYLQFVLDAESHIIRDTGFWSWLWTESNIYLSNGLAVYELPEDCGMISQIIPGNFSGPPLVKLDNQLFRSRFGSVSGSGGPPRFWVPQSESVNNRPQVMLYPTPLVATQPNSNVPLETSLIADPYITVQYYRRRVRPTQPARQLPYIPQEHMDVLIWGAAAHAVQLDTDPNNTQAVNATFQAKLAGLRREQYRGSEFAPDVMRSVGDGGAGVQIPLTRIGQLNGLLM